MIRLWRALWEPRHAVALNRVLTAEPRSAYELARQAKVPAAVAHRLLARWARAGTAVRTWRGDTSQDRCALYRQV